MLYLLLTFFFFSSRRRHTRCSRDWSSDVCSSDLEPPRDRHFRPRHRQRAVVAEGQLDLGEPDRLSRDRKSTRLNSSHGYISYAVFCLKKKKKKLKHPDRFQLDGSKLTHPFIRY